MQIKIKTFSLSLVLVGATLSPAWAQRVLRVSSDAAQEGKVPITVHIEGGGVLLDFAPTDERITDISIDDPSQIVVDHCLVTKSCNDLPSPIIRLFRSSGINFQDIPAAKTTMLSVETIDAQGNYHSYPFPVTIGTGHSLVSKILIEEEDATDNFFNTGTVARNTATPNVIALGVEEAEAKSFLVDPQLKARIRNYLALIESGMSSTKAAQRAGMSTDLVARLAQLGQAKVWSAEAKQQPVALRPNPARVNSTPATNVQDSSTPQNIQQPKPQIVKPTSLAAPVSQPPVTKPAPIVAPLSKPPVTVASTTTYQPAIHHLQANALVKGLIIAKRQKSIDNTIAAKVQDAISNLRSGKDINTAAMRSGVGIDKINELLSLAGV